MNGPSLATASAFRWSEIGDWGTVRLLDVDPDFAVGPADGDGSPRYSPTVPALQLADGPWAPPDALARAVGIVVLDGLVVGTGTTFARPDVRLLGPGDVLDGGTLTEPEVAWRALRHAHLAVLDSAFVLAARKRPALIVGLARRLAEAQREQHMRAHICAMPRVEERILALLCHLAHRWGHVTPDGVTLTLPVTHELLGSLIGARRPTVSLAIRALTEQHLLRRRDEIWILPPDCRTWQASGIPGWARPPGALRAAGGLEP
jgi:CRP/FNR family transcriptional regulator, cyclic AMP receptor protein